MKIKQTIMLVLEGFVFCVLVVALIILVQKYLIPDGASDIKTIQKQFKAYSTSVGHYHKINSEYSDLCSAIGLPDDVACAASMDGYRIEQKLSLGTFYCIDGSGFSGEVEQSSKNRMLCR
ncbi:MAG: hypothetical protein ACI92I_000667 [Acidimicrobiales bacterium]|jgi:hypothetical protein